MKVAVLLDAYPELEQVLVDLAPPFQKLRHPVLRRTVARVTSLAQAAKVANVPLGELVKALRQAVGQVGDGESDQLDGSRSPGALPSGGSLRLHVVDLPDWARNGRIVVRLKADDILATGEHPLAPVQQQLATLKPGEIVLLEGSFRPEPLIDLLKRQGRRVHSTQENEIHRTYISV
jgi:hypothetical protein